MNLKSPRDFLREHQFWLSHKANRGNTFCDGQDAGGWLFSTLNCQHPYYRNFSVVSEEDARNAVLAAREFVSAIKVLTEYVSNKI